MKLFFGGSAVFATALLTASVLFNASPLVAETTNSQELTPTQQQKKDILPPAALPETETLDSSDLDTVIAGALPVNSTPAIPPEITDALPPVFTRPRYAEKTLAPATSPPRRFAATAYSLGGRTASGRLVRKGIIAADRSVLPLGTRVRLDAGSYSGEYVVADTGGAVRGRKIDVWVPNTHEARRFGRRSVKLTVLTYGGKRGASRKGKGQK